MELNDTSWHRRYSLLQELPTSGETSGGIGGAVPTPPPMIKKGILSGKFFGSSYISQTIFKSFIYVPVTIGFGTDLGLNRNRQS